MYASVRAVLGLEEGGLKKGTIMSESLGVEGCNPDKC